MTTMGTIRLGAILLEQLVHRDALAGAGLKPDAAQAPNDQRIFRIDSHRCQSNISPVTTTTAMSSPDFAADVDAYYEAKRSYTEILERTMAQGPPKEPAKSNSTLQDEGISRPFVFAGGPQISPEYPRLDFDMLRKAQVESKASKAKAMPIRKK
ncbi:MAG: hypothetical protein LQ347_002848 [Umbilicaria vellea]|nr:MAG: hypothetical protein LQ347_002848 [Umbilicaria vellea]